MQLLSQKDYPEKNYTKAIVGFGPQESHFVLELIYIYGVEKYEAVTAWAHFGIAAQDIYPIVEKVRQLGGVVTTEPGTADGGIPTKEELKVSHHEPFTAEFHLRNIHGTCSVDLNRQGHGPVRPLLLQSLHLLVHRHVRKSTAEWWTCDAPCRVCKTMLDPITCRRLFLRARFTRRCESAFGGFARRHCPNSSCREIIINERGGDGEVGGTFKCPSCHRSSRFRDADDGSSACKAAAAEAVNFFTFFFKIFFWLPVIEFMRFNMPHVQRIFD
ncbi:zf-C3HC4 domain-containing protein [Psidium guajava]|nr:zf-C3HC4 domain-containing protein [Psidium guajava]